MTSFPKVSNGARRLLVRRGSLALVSTLVALAPIFVGCKKPEEKKSEPTPEPAPTAVKAPVTETQLPPLPKVPEVPIPEDNPQSEAKIALGKKLFFDKRLSVDGSMSCYSCHLDENGNGGATPRAVGPKNVQLPRHSPTLWNVGFLPALYWDGRAASLEAQALGAWGGANMGVGADNLDKKAQEIAKLPEYKAAFAEVFPGEKIGKDHVAKALASYERTLVCNDTAFDKFAAGDKSALSDSARAGLELFMGKAMCVACHAPPHFTTAAMGAGAFFNTGVGTKDVPEDQVDIGRMKVTERDADWAAFKPPTLRNVSRSAPYFHDGHAATLREAVMFMASGGYDNKNKSPLLSDKKLTDTEIDQLVSFLEALECPGRLSGD